MPKREPRTMKSYNRITPDDILEVSDAFSEEFYNDGVLVRVIELEPEILHDARKWGWNDLTIRTRIESVCKNLRIDSKKYLQ